MTNLSPGAVRYRVPPGQHAAVQRQIITVVAAAGGEVTMASPSQELTFLPVLLNRTLTEAGLGTPGLIAAKTEKWLQSLDGVAYKSLREIMRGLASLNPPLTLARSVDPADMIERLDLWYALYERLKERRFHSLRQLTDSDEARFIFEREDLRRIKQALTAIGLQIGPLNPNRRLDEVIGYELEVLDEVGIPSHSPVSVLTVTNLRKALNARQAPKIATEEVISGLRDHLREYGYTMPD